MRMVGWGSPPYGSVDSWGHLGPGASNEACPPKSAVGWAPRAHQTRQQNQGLTDGVRFRHRNVNVDRVRVTPGSLYSFCRRNFS
jgi:hypothetical protein